jgi:uncharacterized protein (DUF1015 family)
MEERRLRAKPFRPITFNPTIGDLSSLIAPPYDIIGEGECAELLARHPFNIVRLILPPTLKETHFDRYEEAGRLWRQWLKEGVLWEEEGAALFVYAQRFLWRGAQREHWALLATVPLLDYETGWVRPHELTMPKPKSDRLLLLRATGAELSQVHGLISDETGEWQALLRAAAQGEAWLRAHLNGVEHLVWRVNDPAFGEAVNCLLANQWLVIADGHHRYETALAFRKELPEAQSDPDHPANFVGIVLADYQRNATVLPTHRLFQFAQSESVERLLRELMRRFRTVNANWDGTDEGLERLLAEAPTVSFLIVAQERVKQVFVYGFESGVAQALEQLPPPLRKVDTAILHHAVLPIVMAGAGIAPESVTVSYTQDAQNAHAFAQDEGCLAILLRPVPLDLVREVAAQGYRLPPKTTYFIPKAPSGLVMRRLR